MAIAFQQLEGNSDIAYKFKVRKLTALKKSIALPTELQLLTQLAGLEPATDRLRSFKKEEPL